MLYLTIPHCHGRLSGVSNVGESDDWQDLYYLVDYLTFAVDKTLPGHPCGKDCEGCCRDAPLFPVTSLEWQAIRRKFPDLALFKARAQLFAEHLPLMEDLERQWTVGQDPAVPFYPQGCPFLEEGSCLIYEARPLICRGYGYFALRVQSDDRLLMCPQGGESISRRLKEGELPLPRWEPYRKALLSLNGGRRIAPLPLWIFTET